jgi:AraC-like DNA-binding protein
MPPSRTLLRLCRARDFIRFYHPDEVRLEDAAAEAALSSWHFLRLFREMFQETPHEFLTRIRVERAKQLLALGDRSVTDICFDVGFSSLGSFSTLFKKHVGASPAAFRRRLRSLVVAPGFTPPLIAPSCFARFYGGIGPPKSGG